MTWPTTFGNLQGGNQPLSLFDGMFQQTAQMLEIPCSASGATAISLTPLVNCPVLTGYTEFCAGRFRAAANSGAGVTAQINGIGFLPVYKADGVTQCGLNDLVINFEYVVRFSQALGGGVGGWFLEAPAVGSGGGSGSGSGIWFPGGRLTLALGAPVMAASIPVGAASQTISYAPYVHPFVPIYNGSTVAMYQFTTGQSDNVGLQYPMGGNAAWPLNTVHDVFVTLVSGFPTLCTIQWTNIATRNIGLAVFGGFLTNAATGVARTNASTTITLQANQGSYLGTFGVASSGNPGESAWRYGGAASGGLPAAFLVYNYYNKLQFNTVVTDNGASYTYSTNTIRSARGSINNAIYFIQGASERVASFQYNTAVKTAALVGANALTSLGIANTTFSTQGTSVQNATALGQGFISVTVLNFTATGLTQCFALEFGDGNANTFNLNSNNTLTGQIWL